MANLQAFERSEYQQVKADLHRKILDRLDLEKLGRTVGDAARDEVLTLIRNSVNSEAVPLSFAEREKLSREILDEIFGLGPLEPLLKDNTISDILVNRFDRVYIERAGKLELTSFSFKDNQHLMQIIDRIVSRIGRRVDEISPMVDARLADGSRVNAIIPPLALDGPAMSVRRFGAKPLQLEDLLNHGAFAPEMMDFISAAVQARCNIIISGGTGSGMTTIHANTTRDALGRLEVMIAMAGYDIPLRALRQQVASAVQLVIQASRLTGGKRKITRVSEITGMEGEAVQIHDIFTFEQTGVDDGGHAVGRFMSTGICPHVMERIENRGIKLPEDLFLRREVTF